MLNLKTSLRNVVLGDRLMLEENRLILRKLSFAKPYFDNIKFTRAARR